MRNEKKREHLPDKKEITEMMKMRATIIESNNISIQIERLSKEKIKINTTLS